MSRVFNSMCQCLEGHTIKWYTDNKNVHHIMQVGSKNPVLHDIVVDMTRGSESRSIHIDTEWVPREQNKQADFLSRCHDSDDWQIAPLVFLHLDKIWGPHTIDRFASDYNTKCIRFNSRWWCPGTEGVDAFTKSWEGENNWLVPPPRLILRVLAKLKDDKSFGTLVIPKWHVSPYWPLLIKHDLKTVSLGTCCTIRGKGNNGVFGKPLKFEMVAVRVDFS